MDYKQFIAKIKNLDSEDAIIDAFLSDEETGKEIIGKIARIRELRREIVKEVGDIRKLCKFGLEDWVPDIEKVIKAETETEREAAETRNRMREIERAVQVALEEAMGPSEIRTIIEIMVIGMQPGKAEFLPTRKNLKKD